jgi:hypothetical protein
MEAAGLGRDSLPRIRPSDNGEYLSNIENTLAANPKARVAFDGAGMAHRIPDALRDVQQDYSAIGSGYDTAAERSGRGTPQENGSANANQPDATASGAERYLRGRLVDKSGRTVFETGAPSVPFVRSAPVAPQTPVSRLPPPSSSSGSPPAGTQYSGNNAWPADGNGSGQALPSYPLPPISGGADPSAPSNADMSDWYTRWVKSLQQN